MVHSRSAQKIRNVFLNVTFFLSGPIVKITDFGLSRLKLSDANGGEEICNPKNAVSSLYAPHVDIEKLARDFRFTPSPDENVSAEEMSQLKSLRSQMLRGDAADLLIR